MPRIKIRWIKSPDVWGQADPQKRTIYLDARMDDKTLMDVALHEALHVCAPFLDEAFVNTFGTVAADVLWRLGYRRTHEDD